MQSKKRSLVKLNFPVERVPLDRCRYWMSNHETACQIWDVPVHGNTLCGFKDMRGDWVFPRADAELFIRRHVDFFEETDLGMYSVWFSEVH